jgi:multidrug efflux pump subunit AcrA (membrane-fusion protein)
MIVEIKIHEMWVDKVKAGKSAKITIDALQNKSFAGVVKSVAPLPDPQQFWLNPDLKVYSAEVEFEETTETLKPGMSAKVQIMIDTLENVVYVPIQSVVSKRGKNVVYVVKNENSPSKVQEVKTGEFNDSYVEICKGLKAGEKIQLNPPRVTDGGTEDKKGFGKSTTSQPTSKPVNGNKPSSQPTTKNGDK